MEHSTQPTIHLQRGQDWRRAGGEASWGLAARRVPRAQVLRAHTGGHRGPRSQRSWLSRRQKQRGLVPPDPWLPPGTCMSHSAARPAGRGGCALPAPPALGSSAQPPWSPGSCWPASSCLWAAGPLPFSDLPKPQRLRALGDHPRKAHPKRTAFPGWHSRGPLAPSAWSWHLATLTFDHAGRLHGNQEREAAKGAVLLQDRRQLGLLLWACVPAWGPRGPEVPGHSPVPQRY